MKLPPGVKYFVLAGVVGLVATVMIHKYITAKAAIPIRPQGPVVVSTVDIAPGTGIDEGMVEVASYPRENTPTKAVGDKKQVDSAIKKILAHRDHPIPSILALRSDVPAEIDRIFHKMVAKRRKDCYQSMAAVIDDLEKAVRPREGFIPGTGQSEKIDSGRESSTWSLGSERDEFRLEPVGGRLRSSEEVTRVPTASDSDDEFGFPLAPPMDEDRYYWQCMGQEVGPFTLRQLRGKKLNPDDLVRSENGRQWLRASEIKGLF